MSGVSLCQQCLLTLRFPLSTPLWRILQLHLQQRALGLAPLLGAYALTSKSFEKLTVFLLLFCVRVVGTPMLDYPWSGANQVSKPQVARFRVWDPANIFVIFIIKSILQYLNSHANSPYYTFNCVSCVSCISSSSLYHATGYRHIVVSCLCVISMVRLLLLTALTCIALFLCQQLWSVLAFSGVTCAWSVRSCLFHPCM